MNYAFPLFLLFLCINFGLNEDELVSSKVQLDIRINYFLFVVSETCTEATFRSLLNLWIKLEEERIFFHWTTNLYFSDQFSTNYSNTTYKSPDSDFEKFYTSSKTADIEAVTENFVLEHDNKECPSFGTKSLIMIFSDTCLLSQLTKLDQSHSDECPMDYQHAGLVLPNEETFYDCYDSFIPEPSLSIWNTSDDGYPAINETFWDIEITYYTKINITTLNVLAVIDNRRYDQGAIVQNFIMAKITSPECNRGPFFGLTQLTTDTGTIKITKLAMPIGSVVFENNLRFENDDSTADYVQNSTICQWISDSLSLLEDNVLDKKQYNVLFLDSDSYPSCVNFTWSSKNRHLEIYIFDGKDKASDFLTLIVPDPEISNHVNFVSSDASEILSADTVCQSSVLSTPLLRNDATTTTEAADITNTSETEETMMTSPFFYSSPETSTTLVTSRNPLIWYIVGIFLISALACLIIFVIWTKLRRRKHLTVDTVAKEVDESFDAMITDLLSKTGRVERQISADDVSIDFNSLLGRGSNSTVLKAVVKYNDKEILAAIKISLDVNSDKIDMIIHELDTFITIGTHPYVIDFLGWVMYSGMPAIIIELCETNLLDHVKTLKDTELDNDFINQMLWQVSSALEYVSHLNIIHRDVACRNILLLNQKIAKLADFGLSCICDDKTKTFTESNKALRFPLRWCSPEALIDKQFSEKSDVWAFGIMCYEMYIYGATPYFNMSYTQIQEFLQFGKRLERPENLPPNLYSLMRLCWKAHPNDRPSFSQISTNLLTVNEN